MKVSEEKPKVVSEEESKVEEPVEPKEVSEEEPVERKRSHDEEEPVEVKKPDTKNPKKPPLVIAIDIESAGSHCQVLSIGAAYVYQDEAGVVHSDTTLVKVNNMYMY